MAVSREQLLASTRPSNLELKARIVCPSQSQITATRRRLTIPGRLQHEIGRENVLSAVRRSDVFGVDLHIKTLLGLILHLEREICDIVAEGLAVGSGNGEIGRKPAGCVGHVGGLVSRA